MPTRVITETELNSYERFYRANLINSVSGYKPAMLIGTQNKQGQTNLAIFSSVVHLGADPALIGFIQRPVDVSGDTYRNIRETGYYTINHVHEPFIEQAHYTSARFHPSQSEFEACRFSPEYINGFAAPFVQESQVKMAMEFVDETLIPYNNTRLIIGAVRFIVLPDHVLEANGNLDLSLVQDVAISGLENYHRVDRIASLPYAKVTELPDFTASKD